MPIASDQYVNLHAHRLPLQKGEWVLTNLSALNYSDSAEIEQGVFSIGLHPWDIESADVDKALHVVLEAARLEKVIGIGETGLDRAIGLSLEIQKNIFERHIEIAGEFDMPLVIHSVKSTQELISLKKRHSRDIPWIVHGYKGGAQQASDLVRAGIFLSIGEAVCSVVRVQDAVTSTPLWHLFIETDESERPIEDIYRKVAELKSVTIKHLKEHMAGKVSEFFRIQ